jgi:hypothetical protein
MTKRCDRNRNRSKRRAICCPIHGCYLDSASRKYRLYADRPEHLKQRGISNRKALTLIQTHTTVPILGEWLEAFWCGDCQETRWYHVRHHGHQNASHRRDEYEVRPAPYALWQQATGVIHPQGNPSVGEFTRKSARMNRYQGIKDWRYH